MESINNLVISGCGTSLYAAQYGAHLMRHLGSFSTVQAVDAAELVTERMPQKDGGLLVISQSGETLDVQRAVVLAEELGVPRFSIINAVGSLIARTTKCGVYINAGREHAVASTKAFVTQVTVLALVAAWFSQLNNKPEFVVRRKELLEALQRLPTYAGMTLQLDEQTKKLAEELKGKDDLFVMGKGFAQPIAMEGALKIKEITYIHAEGTAAGALRHGNLALITPGTPVFVIILNDKNKSQMISLAEEVRAHGGKTIVISDIPEEVRSVSDEILAIPSNGPLTALLSVIPLQLFAYHTAVSRGINPDKPKNLAKAVTVD
jgi:glucosamine--fructose-6-phosphate aminotransferase (isomerizing)